MVKGGKQTMPRFHFPGERGDPGESPIVTFLLRAFTDYRLPFFDKLHDRLQAAGVRLSVHAGQARASEFLAASRPERDWLRRVHNRYLWRGVYWQCGALTETRASALVIFEQASTALYSYPLILRRLWAKGAPNVAFWGHGRGFAKGSRDGLSERWKRLWTPRVDFWFPYTDVSADAVARTGFPADRMAVVNNANDTRSLSAAVREVTPDERIAVHRSLWRETRHGGHRVAVFCSRLFPSKGIGLLTESAARIHGQYEDFRLLVIGDGPLRPVVETFAAGHPWCAYRGPVHGTDRAPLLALADVWLNPGATGLVILDAFACGVPLITVQCPGHGPELAYLRDDNGLLLEARPDAIAAAVVDLIRKPEKLSALKKGALRDAGAYSVEAMADRFSAGILRCLESTG